MEQLLGEIVERPARLTRVAPFSCAEAVSGSPARELLASAPDPAMQRSPGSTSRWIVRWTGFVSQPAFVAVDSGRRAAAYADKLPANSHVPRRIDNAGGGTRTPDTRIMIPRVDT
jgi:hypothetical protein